MYLKITNFSKTGLCITQVMHCNNVHHTSIDADSFADILRRYVADFADITALTLAARQATFDEFGVEVAVNNDTVNELQAIVNGCRRNVSWIVVEKDEGPLLLLCREFSWVLNDNGETIERI